MTKSKETRFPGCSGSEDPEEIRLGLKMWQIQAYTETILGGQVPCLKYPLKDAVSSMNRVFLSQNCSRATNALKHPNLVNERLDLASCKALTDTDSARILSASRWVVTCKLWIFA